jgi:hypothetical protein
MHRRNCMHSIAKNWHYYNLTLTLQIMDLTWLFCTAAMVDVAVLLTCKSTWLQRACRLYKYLVHLNLFDSQHIYCRLGPFYWTTSWTSCWRPVSLSALLYVHESGEGVARGRLSKKTAPYTLRPMHGITPRLESTCMICDQAHFTGS